jgi:predicted RNA binding protein YcfA (HicA-like mRNA interferase family)
MDGREELLARVRARVARCSWDEFLDLSARTLVSRHGVPKSGLWKGFSGAPTAAKAAVGYLAEAYGFSLHVGKGSRRRLSHKSGLVVSVHEPHPRSKPVHPEAVKALLRAIERLEDET